MEHNDQEGDPSGTVHPNPSGTVPPNPSASSSSVLEFIHELQTTVPPLPAEYDHSTGTVWNFGWPMPMSKLDELMERHCPSEVIEGNSYVYKSATVRSAACRVADWSAICHCYVEPLSLDEPRSQIGCSVTARDGNAPVSFWMVISTADRYNRRVRPWKKHMEILIDFIGEEPCWRKDVVHEANFVQYYGHLV